MTGVHWSLVKSTGVRQSPVESAGVLAIDAYNMTLQLYLIWDDLKIDILYREGGDRLEALDGIELTLIH